MRSRWSIAALCALLVSGALVVAGCGSSVPSNAVATVAGNPITKQAFDHWLYVIVKEQSASQPGAPVLTPNDPPQFTGCIAQIRALAPQYANRKTYPDAKLRGDCQQEFTQVAATTLGYLITSYWYQAEAHRQGVEVSDAQVQKIFNTAKAKQFKTNAAFEAYLTAQGTTAEDLMYEIRNVQNEEKLFKKQSTTVTQSQVAAYYDQHRAAYATPEKRTMRIVLAKNPADAAAAHKALASGGSWQTVARRYSQDPQTKNTGGLLSNVTAQDQDAALAKVAFSAPTHKLVGPVKGAFGYYVLQVLSVIPAQQRSLAQSQSAIKKQLTVQKQAAAQTTIQNEAKKAFLGKTHCAKLYSVPECAGYKAPKTPSAAAPATSAQTGSASASSSSAGSNTTSSTSSP